LRVGRRGHLGLEVDRAGHLMRSLEPAEPQPLLNADQAAPRLT
jgi:hypothetical protein